MRLVLGLCALLLALPVLAQDTPEEKPEEEKPPEPTLQELTGGGLTAGFRNADAVYVRLHSGGHLQYKDEKWTNATLASLGEFLGRTRKAHEEKAKKAGKPGHEQIPGAGKVSDLFVAVDADPGTPWQHIQWLMTVAAEQRYWKLELRCVKRRVLVYLPLDLKGPPAKDAPAEITVPIHVIARAEKAAPWGGGMVMRPTRFVYRMGNRETEDLAGVTLWIQEARKAAKASEQEGKPAIVTGEIQSGNKVPFEKIFDVIEAFVKGNVFRVRFQGQAPDGEMRKVERLPYPVKNYNTPD